MLFLRWVAYLGSIGYSINDALWLNMDETPLRFYPRNQRGNTYSRDAPVRAGATPASLRDLRTQVTGAVTVASHPAAQLLLPQLLLPNEQGHKKLWAALPAELTAIWPNIHVFSGSQGWMNNTTMLRYVKLIHEVLTAAGYEKVVLLMDAARVHVSPAVLRSIARKGWRAMLVPSRLTCLLQPLDVYVFADFKRRLYDENVDARTAIANGHITYAAWMRICARAMRSTLAHADTRVYFEKCGCNIPSANISDAVASVVKDVDMGMIRTLSMDELSYYVGMRADRFHKHLFHTVVPPAAAARAIVVRRPAHRFRTKRSIGAADLVHAE